MFAMQAYDRTDKHVHCSFVIHRYAPTGFQNTLVT